MAILLMLEGHRPATATGVAPERILAFNSHITVNTDASMLVTETIRVRSTGEQIRRGIFRDFPTTYKDSKGNRHTVEFVVRAVLRDGHAEDWHTERRANGTRLYVGNKDRQLAPGEHTYTLTYATDRQLGFFRDHDELYWNVTGNGWTFAIDAASATVTLPFGTPGPHRLEAYTGPAGVKGQAYQASKTASGEAYFRTTRPLA